MKRTIAVVAVVAALGFAGVAAASECPLLIKQLKEANISDPAKKAQVEKMVAEAEQLHKDGKHADSVKKADEAAAAAGITLQHRK